MKFNKTAFTGSQAAPSGHRQRDEMEPTVP